VKGRFFRLLLATHLMITGVQDLMCKSPQFAAQEILFLCVR
jgi:hypothetical protein